MPKVSPDHEQRRREQILEAAMACFARNGYHATSMDDIVRESGLSVGALYTYFSSKEELFSALAGGHLQNSLSFLTELFSRPGPLSTKTAEAAEFFFDQLLDENQLPFHRLTFEVWSAAIRSDRLAERNLSRCEGVRDFIVWLLNEGKRTGDIRAEVDVPAAAELLMALHDGLMMHRVSGLRSVPPELLKRAYIDFVNHGLSTAEQTFLTSNGTSPGERSSAARKAAHHPTHDSD